MKDKHRIRSIWKVLCLVCALITITVVPIVINYLYMNGRNLEQPNTMFEASDILSYCGEIFVFIGTSLLAIMAYRQTEKQNERESDYEYANTMCPFFIIERVTSGSGKTLKTAQFDKCRYLLEDPKNVKIHLQNIGAGVATNLTYSTGGRRFGRSPSVVVDPDNHIDEAVAVNGIYKFPVYIPLKWDYNEPVHEKIIEYKNILGYKYSQTISYRIVFESRRNEDHEEQFFVLYVYNISPQKRIGFDGEQDSAIGK